MIAKTDRTLLKLLFQSPQWRVVEQVATELVNKLKTDSVVRDSEWETLKIALLNEGQVRGIKSLLQELFDQAQKND